MSVTCSIAGVSYLVKDHTLAYGDSVTARGTASFTVEDATGLASFSFGQPIVLSDSVRGTLWTGIVSQSTQHNLFPNPNNEVPVTGVDLRYLADKRRVTADYQNLYAGDVATRLLSAYLSAEGVTAGFALRHDELQTDFAAGTLSGVVATTHASDGATGDGDLELAPAGTSLSSTDNSASAFSSGTFSSMTNTTDAASGAAILTLAAYNGLKFSATNVGSLGNTYLYWQIWGGSQTIASGDTLRYDVWVSSTSPECKAGVDLLCSDGTYLRGSGAVDQQNVSAHPGTDLKGLANDQWYSRTISLTALAGKTIKSVMIAFEGDTGGAYTAYFRNIKQWSGAPALKATFYDSASNIYTPASTSFTANQQASDNGYISVAVTPTTVYDRAGWRISPNIDLSGVVIATSSLVSWQTLLPTGSTRASAVKGTQTPSVPTGTSLLVETSLDGEATWQTATWKTALVGLMPGASLTSVGVHTRVTMTITGSSPEVSPALSSMTVTVSSAPTSTRTDVRLTTLSSANWNAGTYTNTQYDGYTLAGLDLAGYSTDFSGDPGVALGAQTLFGGGSPSQVITRQQLQLSSATGYDARSRFDAVSTSYTNFQANVDVTIPANGNCSMGLVYRTTGWQNNNDTYGYVIALNQNPHDTGISTIQFGHGTNSSTGAGAYTSILETNLPFVLVAGNTYHLQIVVSNNTHQAYIDGILYMSTTDNTYASGGKIAARLYNNTGTMTLNRAIVAGTKYSTVDLNDVVNAIADATPITIDTGGVPETVYAYGTQPASTAKTTTVHITTSSSGSKVAQADWTAAGNHAVGATCTVPSTITGTFDNYGVINTTSATWQSPTYTIGGVGTVLDSVILYNAAVPPGCSVLCQTSVDGGTSWQTATSGGMIANVIPGSACPANLLVQFTLTCATANQQASLYVSGFTIWVTNAFSASGNRVTPVLSLTPVGRAGDARVYWDANSGISELSELSDSFARVSASGLGTASNGVFTWNSLVSTHAVLSVGSNEGNLYYDNAGAGYGIFLDTLGYTVADVSVTARFNFLFSNSNPVAALYARLTDANNYYTAQVTLTGVLTLGKTVASAQTVLGTYTMSGLVAGSYFHIRLQVEGSQLAARAWLDGTTEPTAWQIIVSDSTFSSAGYVGIGGTNYSITAGTGMNFDSFVTSHVNLAVDVSPDASTWTDVTAYNGAALPSSYLYSQPSPWLDFFGADTHTSYSTGAFGGGASASWTWDSANKRLLGSHAGGSNGYALYSGYSRADGYIEADFNQCNGGGLIGRHSDDNNAYYAVLYDSAGAFPNTAALWKIAGGTQTQLGSTVAISFAHGDYHRVRLDIQGGDLQLFLDNTLIMSANDGTTAFVPRIFGGTLELPTGSGSVSAAGTWGVLAGASVQCYSVRVQPYGDNQSGKSLYCRQRLSSLDPTITPQLLDLTMSVHDSSIGPGVFVATTNYAQVGKQKLQVSQALDDLVKRSSAAVDALTGASQQYLWNITKPAGAPKLAFHADSALPAPTFLYAGTAGAANSRGNVLWAIQPSITEGDTLYRNRQTIDGGIDTEYIPDEQHAGDGVTQSWTLAYPCAAPPVITLSGPSVTLANATATVGVRGKDTGRDFYYAIGSNVINQDASETPPDVGTLVSFAYYGEVPVRVTVDNTGQFPGTISQSQMAAIDGTSGIVEDYQSVPDLSKAAATALANGLLQQYGKLGITVTLATETPGFASGQLASITLPQYGLYNLQAIITDTKTRGRYGAVAGNVYWTTTITATSGPILGSWDVFLARAMQDTSM